jgi:hypothetical protein
VRFVSTTSSFVDGGSPAYLDNERSIVLQNVINILWRPHARCAHGLNEIRAGQQSDPALLPSNRGLHAVQHAIDLVLEVIQHLRSLQVFSVKRLPRVNGDPAALCDGRCTHVDPVFRLDQSRLLVRVADAGDVGTNNLKVGVEPGVVGSHFKHAQVEEGDGREGATGNEDQRRTLAVFDSAPEAAGGELVLVHGHVTAHVVGHRWRRWWFRVQGE